MRLLLLNLLLLLFVHEIIGQTVRSINGPLKMSPRSMNHDFSEPNVVCYHSDEIIHEYVAAKKNKPKFLKNNNTTFNVTYEDGIRFPQEMVDAFELGTLPIIADIIASDVPINIDVRTTDIPGALAAATFGDARPGGAFKTTFPCFDCWYPQALLEKIVGENINEDGADVRVFINLGQENWYLDYQNPEDILPTQFDFVTVMFHEMVHALGFTGFAGLNDDETGTLVDAGNGLTMAYDFYLENGNGQLLRDLYENNTLRMGTALSNDDLFFNAFKIGQVDERAKLYAPRNFSGGSSIHHVDEGTYQSGPDALMTPTANRGQVLRQGGIAIEMLYDMGWAMTQVDFEGNPEATEELDEDIVLVAKVTSDIAYDENSLMLHVSTDTFQTESLIPMTPTSNADEYQAILVANGQAQNLQYFAEVTDSRGVTRTTPSPTPRFFFSFEFLLDTQGPDIFHEELTSLNEVDQISTLSIFAEIVDVLNIESAAIEWRLNPEDEITSTPMNFNEESENPFAENEYLGVIDFGRSLVETDLFEYRITATDSSKNRNVSIFPSDGSFISIPVKGEIPPVNFYFNNFDQDTEDFEGNGFSISQERNFSTPAIHSTHPYGYGNANGGNSFNLTYELKIPIVIEEQRPVIEFEEVVLIEPGEPGAAFGTDEFWDYVIVEGKRRGTQEWLPFIDGYDSRENASWESAFNNSLSGSGCPTRSVTAGRSSQFQTRKINMVENENFAFGDTVSIRFRLFSDPCLHGWGWAIDNLAIQDLNSNIEEYILESNFDIIPNPAKDQVVIALDLESNADNAMINIVDIMGKVVMTQPIQTNSLSIRESLDIASLPNGIYIVNVAFSNRDVISKKLVKQ